MPHTQNQATADEVMRFFLDGVAEGLPQPASYRIDPHRQSVDVELGCRADLDVWVAYLRFDHDPAVQWRGQPYPLDVDPDQFQEWLTRAEAPWRGWDLELGSDDSITDAQRHDWIDSGRAAERAAWLASQGRKAAA